MTHRLSSRGLRRHRTWRKQQDEKQKGVGETTEGNKGTRNTMARNHTKLPGHSKCLKALRVGRANSGTPVGVIRLLKKSGHTQSH